jgi:hypothetical protein
MSAATPNNAVSGLRYNDMYSYNHNIIPETPFAVKNVLVQPVVELRMSLSTT